MFRITKISNCVSTLKSIRFFMWQISNIYYSPPFGCALLKILELAQCFKNRVIRVFIKQIS